MKVDPQLDNVQRMRDFGALSPKWGVFFKVLSSRLRNLCGREGEKIVIAEDGG